jgi:hypothetical protein
VRIAKVVVVRVQVTAVGAFENSALSDLSGFFSEISLLSSEKNPLRSLGAHAVPENTV